MIATGGCGREGVDRAERERARASGETACVIAARGGFLDGRRVIDCIGALPKESPEPAPRLEAEPTPEPQPDLEEAVGQLIVSRIAGTQASDALLARVRAGEVGGVILFSRPHRLARARPSR